MRMCALRNIAGALVGLMLLTQPAFGQNISAIKNSPDYYWSEGTGYTNKEASEAALEGIMRKIRVFMVSDSKQTDNTQTINGVPVSSKQTQEGYIETYVSGCLENCEERILVDESTGETARVFRWVHKSEIKKMNDQIADLITAYVETGKTAEQRLQIDDALRYYYWAYAIAQASNQAVKIDFDGKMSDARAVLPLKLKSVISSIKARALDVRKDGNRWYADMEFTYNGHPVATLQLRYKDGDTMRPDFLMARDGEAELEMQSLPGNDKLELVYEYRFNDIAQSDASLTFALRNCAKVDAGDRVSIPLKSNSHTGEVTIDKKAAKGVTVENNLSSSSKVNAEEVFVPEKLIEPTLVANPAPYNQLMDAVVKSIRQTDPSIVKPYFTDEAYSLWVRMNRDAKVSLSGTGADREFIEYNDRVVLCRGCKIKLQYPGKSFMEKLVLRYDKELKKVSSFAFALTKKAEDDILNAAIDWPEVSRFTIIQFMEDYQTAYALKRLDYIKSIFSDNALIYVGSVLQESKSKVKFNPEHGGSFDLGNQYSNVVIKKLTKDQFVNELSEQFRTKRFINLTFEDNKTKVLNIPQMAKKTIFAIEIRQNYNSSNYNDTGYLTLVLNMSGGDPMIGVRLWQPEQRDLIGIDEFVNKLEW